MWICNKCGLSVEDALPVCPRCGQGRDEQPVYNNQMNINGQVQPTPNYQQPPQTQYVAQNSQNSSANKNNIMMPIIIAGIVSLIIAIFSGILIVHNMQRNHTLFDPEPVVTTKEYTTQENTSEEISNTKEYSVFFGSSDLGFISYSTEQNENWEEFSMEDMDDRLLGEYQNGSEMIAMCSYDTDTYTFEEKKNAIDNAANQIYESTPNAVKLQTISEGDFYAQGCYSADYDGTEIIMLFYTSPLADNVQYLSYELPAGSLTENEFFTRANMIYHSHSYIKGAIGDNVLLEK